MTNLIFCFTIKAQFLCGNLLCLMEYSGLAGIKRGYPKKGEIAVENKNCVSIGKWVGDLLDGYLYRNRGNCTAAAFAKRLGVSAKTVQRWRYNGIPLAADIDLVLQAIGATCRVVLEPEDDSVFVAPFPV